MPTARCGADAKNMYSTLDGERAGAAIIEDISGDQNKTGATTAPGTSGTPRENVAPEESQRVDQKAWAPYPVTCDVAKKFFASYFTTGSKTLAPYLPYLQPRARGAQKLP